VQTEHAQSILLIVILASSSLEAYLTLKHTWSVNAPQVAQWRF